MTYYSHGAIIAAQQSRKRKEQEQEEEKMSKEMYADLENWEFKIVRSYWNDFGNPQKLQVMLEEEGLAGWEMMEKLDDSRVRLRRRKEMQKRDMALPPGIDPYRTQYGGGSRSAIAVGISVFTLLLGVLAAFFIGGSSSNPPSQEIPWVAVSVMIPAVLVIIGLIVVAITKARRL
ncbi:MAG: hypothetical protein OEY93_08235 [Anaerolineae bacterium]|nr:hypothetical protein [Anaerolineae bacterium]